MKTCKMVLGFPKILYYRKWTGLCWFRNGMSANYKFRVAKKVVNKYLNEFQKKDNTSMLSLNRAQQASSTAGAK